MNINSTTKETVPVNQARRMEGVVVRRSGDKTIAVAVTRVTRHPKYGKKVVSTKRYLVHDPENAGVIGEQVILRESRPISARKRWVVEKESK